MLSNEHQVSSSEARWPVADRWAVPLTVVRRTIRAADDERRSQSNRPVQAADEGDVRDADEEQDNGHEHGHVNSYQQCGGEVGLVSEILFSTNILLPHIAVAIVIVVKEAGTWEWVIGEHEILTDGR